MKFNDKLNEYIELLSCTAKDICNISGISAASFSRYKNGERMPEYGSETFDNLCRAIAQIAQSKGISDITIELVKENFIACDNFVATDRELLRQ